LELGQGKVSTVILRSLTYRLWAGKLWSEESQGGWWARGGPCSLVPVAARAFWHYTGPHSCYWCNAAAQVSEGEGWFSPVLTRLQDICTVCWTPFVMDVMPSNRLRSVKWCLNRYRANDGQKAPTKSHHCFPSAPCSRQACANPGQEDVAGILPSSSLPLCRAAVSHLVPWEELWAARCSPALPVPKDTAALKQANKSYAHGDIGSWASQVERPELIDILDWIFLCLCSLSIKG